MNQMDSLKVDLQPYIEQAVNYSKNEPLKAVGIAGAAVTAYYGLSFLVNYGMIFEFNQVCDSHHFDNDFLVW